MGFIPSWFPTFGLGPVLSVGLAKLVRVNTVAAFVGGVIGSCVWPLLFLFNYKIGSLILDRKSKIDELEEVDYRNALIHTLDGIESIHTSGYLFLTGAIINTLITSIFLYFIVSFLFRKYRLQILDKIK
jgi:uncharacterized protein